MAQGRIEEPQSADVPDAALIPAPEDTAPDSPQRGPPTTPRQILRLSCRDFNPECRSQRTLRPLVVTDTAVAELQAAEQHRATRASE